MKYIAYRDPPQTINYLETEIREAIRVINEDSLKRVFKNLETRLNFVGGEKGGNFEHIMN